MQVVVSLEFGLVMPLDGSSLGGTNSSAHSNAQVLSSLFLPLLNLK